MTKPPADDARSARPMPASGDAGPATGGVRPPAAGHLAGCPVHLVGIGGCGMSGLAFLLRELGARCSGSDAVPNDLTEALDAAGIPVGPDDGTAPGAADAELVVASAAIPPEHPTLAAASARGVPVLSYAEALGLVQSARTGLSIAGTHGKSTTTAMLCHVLMTGGLDPGFIVGATCRQIGGGSRCGAATIPAGPYAGRPGLLLAEACEFRRSFHHHRPVLGAILNVEEDHLDVYGSLDAIVEAFRDFARLLPAASQGGRLLIAHESAHRREVTAGVQAAVATFGFAPAADYQVTTDPDDGRVRLRHRGRVVASWTPRMPGDHNAMNAAAAAVLAAWLGVPWRTIADALGEFEGLDRRTQRLGDRPVAGGHVTVYDDYGHHPTEIDATLRALRAAEAPERVVCVFQPHQHSRTRFLLDEFAQAFSSADVVIVPQIYFVRDSEVERTRVSAADLVDRLRQRGCTAMHLHPFEAIVEQLDVLVRPGDLVVVMGAGPVWTIARDFIDAAMAPSHDAIAHASPTGAPAALTAAHAPSAGSKG